MRGADLTNAVVLDSRNITEGSISVSVAEMASDVYGTGTASDTDPITSLQSDAIVRAAYGRTAAAETFDGVSQQTTLDDHTARLLAKRKVQWFQPGAGLHPVSDVDVDSFDPGDTVAYVFDAGLGVHEGEYRIVAKQVTVDASGQEAISVEFE